MGNTWKMKKVLSKKIIKIGGLSAFFTLIVIYIILGSKDLIFGVRIRNVNLAVPEALLVENSTSKASGTKFNIIKLTGNAKNAVDLILNGREISVDKQGNFSETIALLSGYNIISIKARDKFEYVDEKNYKLMLKNE